MRSLLSEREDINPNTADTEYGQTPLSGSEENRYGRGPTNFNAFKFADFFDAELEGLHL